MKLRLADESETQLLQAWVSFRTKLILRELARIMTRHTGQRHTMSSVVRILIAQQGERLILKSKLDAIERKAMQYAKKTRRNNT